MILPHPNALPTLNSGLQSGRPSSSHPSPRWHHSLCRVLLGRGTRLRMTTAGGAAYAGVAMLNRVSAGLAQQGVAVATVARRATARCMYAGRMDIVYVRLRVPDPAWEWEDTAGLGQLSACDLRPGLDGVSRSGSRSAMPAWTLFLTRTAVCARAGRRSWNGEPENDTRRAGFRRRGATVRDYF
jgi:hypothetical protein